MKIPMTSKLKIGVCLLGLGLLVACDSSEPKPAVGGGPVPAEFQVGETTFNSTCAACHGKQAAGTDHGPPLVHKVYEPNHHGDPGLPTGCGQRCQGAPLGIWRHAEGRWRHS